MRVPLKQINTLLLAWLFAASCLAAECIVPSKPGGGFHLTCKLVQQGLQIGNPTTASADTSMRISYMPGGIGAVAWNSMISRRRAEPDTLVAFSGGSVLNVALGKFGKTSVDDVRWVAAVGADYGMIAVRSDSPYKTLRDFIDALKRDPAKLTIGAGGTIGSQDWIKVVLLAKLGRADPKPLRFVAFEGGGEAFTALLAGYVQAVSGDASEASLHASDKIRVLAVLSEARLPGAMAQVPTAREQGFDLTWPIIRGVYMGPQATDADYRKWVARFDRMLAAPEFAPMRAAHGLYPFALTGAPFTEYIKKTVDNYGMQAKELGLIRPQNKLDTKE